MVMTPMPDTTRLNPHKRHVYWATSKDMHHIKQLVNGYWLEYNPSIGMYRINHKHGTPLEIMGYSLHQSALVRQFIRYEKAKSKRSKAKNA